MVDAVISKPTVIAAVKAQSLGKLGLLYHAYELNDAAVACYRNALLQTPGDDEWSYALAYLYQTLGTFTEALTMYRQILSRQTQTAPLYLLNIRIGECLRHLNQPKEARMFFQKARQLNPTDPAAQARLGEIALEQKRYKDAVDFLTVALKMRPDADKLHYQLGMAYRYLGQMELAREHMSQYGMVGIQPPDPLKRQLEKLLTGYRVHLLAGRLAYSAGRFLEAEKSFAEAVAADPTQSAALINLGATQIKLNRVNDAVANFNKAVLVDPDNVTVHFNLGSIYTSAGQYNQAVVHLQKVISLTPSDALAHKMLADLLTKTGSLSQAEIHYRKALTLDPALSEGWLNLSALYRAGNYPKQALDLLEEAHRRLPHDLDITLELANLLAAGPVYAYRNGGRALELAQNVFKERNDILSAQVTAIAYAELNECDKAVEWMEKTIQAVAADVQALELMGNLENLLAYFKTRRPCRAPSTR